jgi:hypothetical protein
LGLLRQDRPRMPIVRRVARNLLKTEQNIEQRPEKPRKVPNKRNTRPLPPPEPYQAPPPPPEPPIGSFRLLDLRQGHCRWPEGSRAPYQFCGAKQASQSSYCPSHTEQSLSGQARHTPFYLAKLGQG